MIMATIDYDYKIDVIRDKIEEIGASNVILQFPEGLKVDAMDVADRISEVVDDVNIIIDDRRE